MMWSDACGVMVDVLFCGWVRCVIEVTGVDGVSCWW